MALLRSGSASGGRRSPEARPDQVIDLHLILVRARRLARLDSSVLREVRDDPTLTLSAGLIVVVTTLLAAVGGWLWLIVEADGISTGRVAVREFVLGSLFAIAVWGGWLIAAHVMLESVFGRTAPMGRLFRSMGYAALPAAGALLLVIPALSFAVGLLVMMAWFAASHAAIEAAAPHATRTEVLVANLTGFAVYVVVLSVLAAAAGVAPGFFVHAADLSAYAETAAAGVAGAR